MTRSPDQKTVISSFVHALAPGLAVERWPDEEERSAPDIDAIAGRYAIEHTSVDVLPDQRLYQARFAKLFGAIYTHLSFEADRRFVVAFRYEDLLTIRDLNWAATEIAPALEQLLSQACDHLVFQQLGSLTLRGAIWARQSSRPGIYLSPMVDTEEKSSVHLEKQLQGKVQKLARYQGSRYTTILLIESADLALMNHVIVTDLVRSALGRKLPCGVDQVWFVDSSTGEVEFWDLTAAVQQMGVYPSHPHLEKRD